MTLMILFVVAVAAAALALAIAAALGNCSSCGLVPVVEVAAAVVIILVVRSKWCVAVVVSIQQQHLPLSSKAEKDKLAEENTKLKAESSKRAPEADNPYAGTTKEQLLKFSSG